MSKALLKMYSVSQGWEVTSHQCVFLERDMTLIWCMDVVCQKLWIRCKLLFCVVIKESWHCTTRKCTTYLSISTNTIMLNIEKATWFSVNSTFQNLFSVQSKFTWIITVRDGLFNIEFSFYSTWLRKCYFYLFRQ